MTADPNHTANMYNVARLLVPVLIEAGVDATMPVLPDVAWRLAVAEAARRDVDRFNRQINTAESAEQVQSIPKPWMPKPDYFPSESTRRLVAEMIKAETAPTPTTDPFEGLPS